MRISFLRNIFIILITFYLKNSECGVIHRIKRGVAGATCTTSQDFTGVDGDCTRFLRCVYGTFYAMSCPSGTSWDYIRKVCDFTALATCFPGATVATSTVTTTITTTVTTATTTAAALVAGASCAPSQDLTGVASDCTKFLRCVYGTAYELTCATGLTFDYIQKTCRTGATCLGATTTVTTATATTTTATTTTATTATATTTTATTTTATTTTATTTFASCTSADDLSADPTDCTKFRRCVYGTLYSISCPSGQNFLASSRTCSSTAPCSITTTVSTTTACVTLTCQNGFNFNSNTCSCPCGTGFSGTTCQNYNCALTPTTDSLAGTLCNSITCAAGQVSGLCPFKCLCGSTTA